MGLVRAIEWGLAPFNSDAYGSNPAPILSPWHHFQNGRPPRGSRAIV
jgi:hypothetical protein